MIETVLFDFDGTLADTNEGIVRTLLATLDEMGLPRTDRKTISDTIGLPLSESVRIGGNVPPDRVDEGVATYRRLFDTVAMPGISLFDGVKETLLELKARGKRLAIATSRGQHSLDNILREHGIFDCFCEKATSNGSYKPKPAPDMVLYLLDLMGARAEDTLVVGDTTYDLEMGKGALCQTCGVTYGNHDRNRLASCSPDHVIDSFRDLLDIV